MTKSTEHRAVPARAVAWSAVLGAGLALSLGLTACTGDTDGRQQAAAAQSCMTCHNGSQRDDYSGPGIENPHPFPNAPNLQCTTCHGGNPLGADQMASHVPPPPEIGDRAFQAINRRDNRRAWFNKLTLTGLDKIPDYTVNGVTYTALDYLQFLNPGDLRVTTAARGCGQCHSPHSDVMAHSLLATEAGIFSGAMFAAGADNAIPANRNVHEDTAADLAFRAVTKVGFNAGAASLGAVGSLMEFPVYSIIGDTGPNAIHNNNNYTAANLAGDLDPDNSVTTGSRLANLYHEQVAFTCGDCHLGSSGANNRYGDFRSSGCTACHMPYSLDGRSRSGDPNVPMMEPLDPDDIDPPERAHVKRHRIQSIAKTLPDGTQVEGISDYACAGCHQGSNRTVMQYWGIRLDQNQDLRRGVQYPANPVTYRNTSGDTRLFDPAVGNNTFNGRNRNQYIAFEDYDGDGRDDTPADVHYEAGMGCIDCHGSYDLHGGDVNNPGSSEIFSRMEQAVAIECESCHGSVDAYATVVAGTRFDGQPGQVAVDRKGNQLPHVVLESDGHYWLTSKLTGQRHFIPQTRDTSVNTGVINPVTNQPVYSPKASFAMGRAFNDPLQGVGPMQSGSSFNAITVTPGFTHTANMDCASCHASWTNTCMGCHLEGEYNTGNNFSNITGDSIAFRERNADFVYQSPVFFQLGVDAHNKITQVSSNTKMFFKYRDRQGNFSQVFAFSDRKGMGNNPANLYPPMSHNAMMAHSIRGKVSSTDEGPRYCVACHLTTDSLSNPTVVSQYATFRNALATNNFAALDFNLLRTEIGLNPGNQRNTPFFVHMVAGLGSGLFLFDQNGCPVNPLDNDTERKGCNFVAPASVPFSAARVAFNLDRIVDINGVQFASSNHALLVPPTNLRAGSTDPTMAGPLGGPILQRLADPAGGLVLDAWIDADGILRGNASTYVR